jgi:O-antigen ligase
MMMQAVRSEPVRARLVQLADWLAVATAVSLPWSTSATGILVAVWVVVFLLTLDRGALERVAPAAAAILPLAIVAYAIAGTLWSDVAWSARLSGIAPIAKLLVIPMLFVHFARSDAAERVFIGIFAAACVLLALSWLLVLAPGLPWRAAGFGVPVKDYISQSGIFVLCIAALLDRALTIWKSDLKFALIYGAAAIVFLADIVFVASSRTMLIVLVVLLVMLGVRHFRNWALGGFLGGLVVLAAIAWVTSPYLRYRVLNVAQELNNFRANEVDTSSGARIAFWKQSVEIVGQAPLLGHGTGSTREVMSRNVGADPQLRGAPSNPHNQFFAMAIPLGLIGVALMAAMWIVHWRMFLAPGPVAWIGLAVVTQNIVAGFFNSHLFDFTQGWLYVIGVGVAGGALMHTKAARP